LGLRKPASSDDVTVDTDLGSNFDAIDAAAGFTSCTSATRPSAPFVGQAIYETDTKLAFVHNGTSPASAGWERTAFNTIRRAASTSPPTNIVAGHVWMESDTHILKVSNGTNAASGGWEWPSIPVVTGPTPPNPWSGMVVFNLSDNRLYRYDGSTWYPLQRQAKYARTSGAQAVSANTDTQIVWPSAIAVDSLVTPQGTNNAYFTIQPGLWLIEACVRRSAAGAMDMYIAMGTTFASAPDEGNTIAMGGTGAFTCSVAGTVNITTATNITVGVYSAAAININPFGTNATHIAFTRLG
jgi:hypothetical protein